MGLLNWLFGRAPRAEDPLPESLITISITTNRTADGFSLTATIDDDKSGRPHDAEQPDQTETDSEAHQPLENLYCMIEYFDAAGVETRRPITMLSLDTRYAIPCIFAVCHLRRATRTFRADRIRNVITADGEVFTGRDFMVNLMGLDPAIIPPFDAARVQNMTIRGEPIPMRPRTFRSEMMAPLTVLVACGKADGHFHPDELDRIMSWAEREALHMHRANLIDADLTLDEANALGKVIGRMRPQQRTLQHHILTTLKMDAPRLGRFRRALQNVIVADGITHDQEAQFLAEFDRLAEAVKSGQDAVVDEIAKVIASLDPSDIKSVDLKKAVYIFTGTFVRISRRQAMDIVEARNGVVKEHIGSGYPWLPGSCLVWGAGGGGGRKREDALEVGMPVITEDEFLSRMGLG